MKTSYVSHQTCAPKTRLPKHNTIRHLVLNTYIFSYTHRYSITTQLISARLILIPTRRPSALHTRASNCCAITTGIHSRRARDSASRLRGSSSVRKSLVLELSRRGCGCGCEGRCKCVGKSLVLGLCLSGGVGEGLVGKEGGSGRGEGRHC